MEIIIKEESRIEKVEKKDKKGDVVLDENEQPVLEDKEVIEQKEYVRTYSEEPKDFVILQLEREIEDDEAEIARRQAHKVALEEQLASLK